MILPHRSWQYGPFQLWIWAASTREAIAGMGPSQDATVAERSHRRFDRLKLAEMASAKGVILVLFTDQWGSPAARHATHSFNCRIEAPSAGDSSVVTLFIVEALEARTGKPVVTSNQAMAWDALRLAGVEDRVVGYGWLLRIA